MAFKYLIFSFEGGPVMGTDDPKVAKEFASQDEYLVVDTESQLQATGYEIEKDSDWTPILEQADYEF